MIFRSSSCESFAPCPLCCYRETLRFTNLGFRQRDYMSIRVCTHADDINADDEREE
jgi:hypothetical protein